LTRSTISHEIMKSIITLIDVRCTTIESVRLFLQKSDMARAPYYIRSLRRCPRSTLAMAPMAYYVTETAATATAAAASTPRRTQEASSLPNPFSSAKFSLATGPHIACSKNAHSSQKVQGRHLSSSNRTSRGSSTEGSEDLGNNEPVLLFRRDPDFTLMRTGIGLSSFHTAYWLWYITDFIPLVNASPMEELHIDPTLGLVGLIFSFTIQAVFFVYPTRLISKLEYVDRERQQLRIYTHTIPVVRPAAKPTVVSVGQVVLDPSAEDTQTVLNQHQGDLEKFHGHIGVGPPTGSKTKLWSLFPYMSYLMDIRDPSNVPEPDLLLQLLLHSEDYAHQPQHSMTTATRRSRKRSASGASSTSTQRARALRQRRESQLQKILKRRITA